MSCWEAQILVPLTLSSRAVSVNQVETVEALRPACTFGPVSRLQLEEPKMPIFEYICKECDHQFEALVFGNKKASCPKCSSKNLVQQLSVFAVSARSESSSNLSSGACGSCGDPRGPGACSMPDLD